ncbi:hypothetical protein L6452_36111 [Arctium lappa]|uniref:Uncharacterized protein n=1 Tax=Arctium lappa TaxID=4217 RepID=A0ACB8Y7N4_ARCLA|nr:hypothetical protein L6452_36111 [Arctium lappa]
MEPGVVEPSTMGGANAQGRSLDKRIHFAFFVESSTSEKKFFAEDKKLTHFIRWSNHPRLAGTTKTTISLFPFFGATFFFPRDGVGVYNNLFFEYAREQLLRKFRKKCWNLMAKDKVMELIDKFIDLGGIGELIKGIEMMIEIILRNRRIPYGYNFYLNEVKKMRSLLSNRTKTNTLIESVKIKSVYQSASPIAQDISFQPRNKTRSFRSIFSQIVKDIRLVMKKGVEGIRICCSGRSEGAEIARTECGKYGKTSSNVFNQKIDYAPAEVSTRYGISGVKVWISYSQKERGRAISETYEIYCRDGRLSYQAIEAARRAIIGQFHRTMSGQFRRNGKIWVRVLADLPITGKPTEVRMGRGKRKSYGLDCSFASRYVVFPNVDGLELHIPEEKEMSVKKPLPDVDLKVTIQQRLFGVSKRGTDRSDYKIKGQKLDWIKHQLWKLIRRWLEGKASALASKDCALVNEAKEKERSSSLKVRTKRKEQRRHGYNLAWESV